MNIQMQPQNQTQTNFQNNASESSKVLRFITAGSVDDGKSTLIGRLLYDTKAVFEDQIRAIENSKHKRTVGEKIDFSLLTDGLESEREQGITIDVAYRYFSTAKRKFIVADAPGHEQYTRNMVTGASNSDAAIILIDITRIDWQQDIVELLAQTKRHSNIVHLLGLQHIIVAVNKIDLIDYAQHAFDKVVQAYQQLAQQIGINAKLHFVPISALNGDNIVHKSPYTNWFTGQTLLEILEQIPIELHPHHHKAAAFSVQYVMRQDGSHLNDFRGYMGRLESGNIKILQTPQGQTVHIQNIFIAGGTAVNEAESGQSLTITLSHDIDISRGDILIEQTNTNSGSGAHFLQAQKQFQAKICWLDHAPNHQGKYLFRHTHSQIACKIQAIHDVLDIHTLAQHQNISNLNTNDIARIEIQLQKTLPLCAFEEHHAFGSFILIDEVTHRTVAAGFIL
jgi:sulfate adenylyltransferase subunit 1